MVEEFTNELDGQIKFYKSYLPLVDHSISVDDVYEDYTDGIVNGNLLEFKLVINDINKVLFQAIKYLSARRIKGKEIPKNILLVSLRNKRIYVFDSADYIDSIEKVYFGSASVENGGFISDGAKEELDYGSNELHEARLIEILRSHNFTKINIDENCIVGWAERFYRENPSADKKDFIGDNTGKVNILGEIRRPNKLKDFINPYTGETNKAFQYLMDKLNDKFQKKNLGAFYTPEQYAKKSIELVRQAIKRVPKGNDYIILDRCAGTGNLEKHLSEEELSHCILSTIEYYEYKVLVEILGDKVRRIIPPTEKEDTFSLGLVRGADALSEEYINNPIIKQYVNDPNVTIILFENPPYAEVNGTTRKTGSKSTFKNSFIAEKMAKEVKGTAKNELGNLFIWSAFKYYLRQTTDSYIVYSPIKYWKSQHLINKRLINGFAFNRRYFHTNIDALVSCILWSFEDENIDDIILNKYNLDNGEIIHEGKLEIKKIYSKYSNAYFDKRKFENDTLDGIACDLTGIESRKAEKSIRVKKLFNKNIIGYLVANGTSFDNPDLNSGLTISGRYDGNGFFLRSDNFLEKLPMFVASRYVTYNRQWTQRANIMKSADGSKKFFEALEKGTIKQELLRILLFTTLETQNHMRSFQGSDGRFYRNQLTLDNSNGENLATKALSELNVRKKEQQLLDQWKLVFKEAKKTDNYNPEYSYSLYQIIDELDIVEKIEHKNQLHKYPELYTQLKTLKKLVKDYYLSEIVPFLFEYEFLK